VSSASDIASGLTLSGAAQDLLFRTARTANTFADTPVSDDQLLAIYDLVKWGPTSGNTQPLRITALRSTEAKLRLVPHLNEPNRAKSLTAPVVAILSADLDFHEYMNRLLPYLDNARDRFADPAARRRIAEYNAILQAGYFILGIRAAGLAAGPMTGFNADGVDGEFFPAGGRRSLMVVNIGYPGPGAWLERLPRLDDDEVIEVLLLAT
jgi:3-hydroxypropanoate dehydrogenase